MSKNMKQWTMERKITNWNKTWNHNRGIHIKCRVQYWGIGAFQVDVDGYVFTQRGTQKGSGRRGKQSIHEGQNSQIHAYFILAVFYHLWPVTILYVIKGWYYLCCQGLGGSSKIKTVIHVIHYTNIICYAYSMADMSILLCYYQD